MIMIITYIINITIIVIIINIIVIIIVGIGITITTQLIITIIGAPLYRRCVELRGDDAEVLGPRPARPGRSAASSRPPDSLNQAASRAKIPRVCGSASVRISLSKRGETLESARDSSGNSTARPETASRAMAPRSRRRGRTGCADEKSEVHKYGHRTTGHSAET